MTIERTHIRYFHAGDAEPARRIAAVAFLRRQRRGPRFHAFLAPVPRPAAWRSGCRAPPRRSALPPAPPVRSAIRTPAPQPPGLPKAAATAPNIVIGRQTRRQSGRPVIAASRPPLRAAGSHPRRTGRPAGRDTAPRRSDRDQRRHLLIPPAARPAVRRNSVAPRLTPPGARPIPRRMTDTAPHPQLLHRRPHRPREIHPRRPADPVDRHRRRPRHEGAAARLDGHRARARHHHQGQHRPPRLRGQGRPDLRPQPHRHPRPRRLRLRGLPLDARRRGLAPRRRRLPGRRGADARQRLPGASTPATRSSRSSTRSTCPPPSPTASASRSRTSSASTPPTPSSSPPRPASASPTCSRPSSPACPPPRATATRRSRRCWSTAGTTPTSASSSWSASSTASSARATASA